MFLVSSRKALVSSRKALVSSREALVSCSGQWRGSAGGAVVGKSCRLVLGSYRQRAEQIKQGPRYMSLCLADCVALVPETCCPTKVWASEFRIAWGGEGVKRFFRS